MNTGSVQNCQTCIAIPFQQDFSPNKLPEELNWTYPAVALDHMITKVAYQKHWAVKECKLTCQALQSLLLLSMDSVILVLKIFLALLVLLSCTFILQGYTELITRGQLH